MKKQLLLLFIFTTFIQCIANERLANNIINENKLQGFLFVNISKIYHHNGQVTIVTEHKDTIVNLINKTVRIKGAVYQAIEEDYLYKKYLNIETLDPEYGLFILKCYGMINGFYRVEINGEVGLISNDLYKKYIEYKDLQRYIMETYPIPTLENPLRAESNENSEVINDFNKWTFVPIEIKGDWVKVIDNKDCYKGVAPSINDIVGWIRWRKDGEFILKVAHVC